MTDHTFPLTINFSFDVAINNIPKIEIKLIDLETAIQTVVNNILLNSQIVDTYTVDNVIIIGNRVDDCINIYICTEPNTVIKL